MKKKIVIFSGAGLDKESGIDTFRDTENGYWYNYDVNEVATIEGWRKDRKKVLEFHNLLRSKLPSVQPNDAHKGLVSLEEHFEVIHVTQNVSDLLERAGATNIYHLHGELTKVRGSLYENKTSPLEEVQDIGYKEINIGDKCATGSQLRPHIVWFGEYPFNIIEAYRAIETADILLVIGTSLQIGYTLPMLASVNPIANIYYIDPSPERYLDKYNLKVSYITKGASEGVAELVSLLTNQEA